MRKVTISDPNEINPETGEPRRMAEKPPDKPIFASEQLHSLTAKPLHFESDMVECAVFAQAIVRLIFLCKKTGFQPLGKHRDEAVRIGEDLYKVGSQAGMQVAYYAVQAIWASGFYGPHTENNFHPRELEMAWDGIGQWRG